jgi:hypothetical protein
MQALNRAFVEADLLTAKLPRTMQRMPAASEVLKPNDTFLARIEFNLQLSRLQPWKERHDFRCNL